MGLTELQLAILDVLWQQPGVSLTEIHDRLREERKIAQSTVATLLYRMEDRGLVERSENGRKYRYWAGVSMERARESAVAEFAERTDRLFCSKVASLVSQLLATGDFTTEDLAQARRIIAKKERELGSGNP